MYRFHKPGMERSAEDETSADSVTAAFFSASNTAFFVEKSKKEQLHVVLTPRGRVVIYSNFNEPYTALDASVSEDWSQTRKTLIVNDEPTPFFANVVIDREQARSVVHEFCRSGTLWQSLFWLREGSEPR